MTFQIKNFPDILSTYFWGKLISKSTNPFVRKKKSHPYLRATQSNKLRTGPPEIKVMETSKLMRSPEKVELLQMFKKTMSYESYVLPKV